ncbi:MAG: hypothetical protein LLG02_11725 [Pelosinus sp.]|nr:hypothetical protein [Pelosinus sp.]
MLWLFYFSAFVAIIRAEVISTIPKELAQDTTIPKTVKKMEYYSLMLVYAWLYAAGQL